MAYLRVMRFEEIRDLILPVLKKHGVSKAAIFGSFARNQERKGSDIDLLVELRPGDGLLEFVGLKIELEEELNCTVDLVEYEALKPALRERILGEQVVLL